VGVKLREARERRGVSLREIANATKISMSLLEALERNDIARLPGGIFSRAFVRAYAIEVGLDPEETIQEFITQFPQDSVTAGHPTAAPVEDELAIEGERRTASVFLWLSLVSVPIAATLLYFTISGWPQMVRPAVTPTSTVPVPAPLPVEAPAVPVPPPPPIPEVPRPSEHPAGAGVIPPPPTIDAAPLPPNPSPQPPQSADAGGEPLAVTLSATGACRVVALVDGVRRLDRGLNAGDSRMFDVRHDLVLTVSDPAFLIVTFNGVAAASLGKAGESVTTTVTPANFKQYLPQ
jgi:cytoskeletal protein RodZ